MSFKIHEYEFEVNREKGRFIILNKVFKIGRPLRFDNDRVWKCSHNGKTIISLRIYHKGFYQGCWYLCFFGTPWIPISGERKAATVKAMALDYILTHFNNL